MVNSSIRKTEPYQDPILLRDSMAEFQDLRKELYLDPKLKGFRKFSNENIEKSQDESSTLFIIKHKGQCIGGAKFTVSTPINPISLPFQNEVGNPSLLERELSNLRLKTLSSGEFSRLVLLPEYRSGKILEKVFSHFTKRMLQNRVAYVFILTDAMRTRRYRTIFRKLNLSFETRNDIIIPDLADFEGKKMYLSVIDLRNKYRTLPHPLPGVRRNLDIISI